MNFRRGLSRIYLLAWIAWALYWIIFPYVHRADESLREGKAIFSDKLVCVNSAEESFRKEKEKLYRQAKNETDTSWAILRDLAESRRRTEEELENCNRQEALAREHHKSRYDWGKSAYEYMWPGRGWIALATMILIVPLLTCLGIVAGFKALRQIIMWIVRGFTER